MDPLSSEDLSAAILASYAAATASQAATTLKTASEIAKAGGSLPSSGATTRTKAPSVWRKPVTLGVAPVSVFSPPQASRRGSLPAASGTMFVHSPMVEMPPPSALTMTASTLGSMASTLAGGAHGLFVPPVPTTTEPALPTPEPTPGLEAACAAQAVAQAVINA